MTAKPRLILASGSSSRRAMLHAAGVRFMAMTPDVDEDSITAALAGTTVPAGIADALAEAKALAISGREPDALIIGGDQILVCGGVMIAKSTSREEAREVLKRLRGTEHMLVSAMVLAQRGAVVWRGHDKATLRMRNFSDAFLDSYLDVELPDILGSVGCYRIEGRGAQLFESIEGDQFCIRGLPLLQLLDVLRTQGALLS